MAHKLTVRLDDEIWDNIREIARIGGVSATALVQATMAESAAVWEERGWTDPATWPDQDEMARRWRSIIRFAREIDERRRARGAATTEDA